MATITAIQTGNWSSTGTWDTGTLPQPGDLVRSAAYIVTIDQDVNIGAGTLQPNGAAGYFKIPSTLVGTRTITANLVGNLGTVLVCEHVSGSDVVINGNVTGAGAGSKYGIYNTSTGTVTITGNVTGGMGTSSYGVNNALGGSIVIVGNVLGGGGSSADGVYNDTTGTVSVTGSVTGGSVSGTKGLTNNGLGSVSVVGNVFGGTAQDTVGLRNSAGGAVTVTGNVLGGSGTSSHGVLNYSTGTFLVTGNVTGGSGSTSQGARNEGSGGSGTMTITGSATGGAGTSSHGAGNIAGGVLIVGRAIGNDYGPGGTHSVLAYGVSGANNASAVTRVKSIQFGAHGQSPVIGAAFITPDAANNVAVLIRYDTLAQITLTDPGAAADFPAIADVRYGTSYDSGDKVGTLRVPAANQVAAGVPVDNTVGTATLTLANLQSALNNCWPPLFGG